MKLYTYYRSSASYRVRIALNLKGLDANQVAVNLLESAHRDADFLRVNPQGLVPALLTDEGVVLTQSLAIMEYLDERHPTPALLPALPEERARVRALAQSIACEMAPLNNLRVLKFLTGEMRLTEEAKVQWYKHWIAVGFDAVEALLAGNPYTGRFCHGDMPGMADACLVPQVFNAERCGCDLTPYPVVRRISEACNALPAFARAHPAQQPDAK